MREPDPEPRVDALREGTPDAGHLLAHRRPIAGYVLPKVEMPQVVELLGHDREGRRALQHDELLREIHTVGLRQAAQHGNQGRTEDSSGVFGVDPKVHVPRLVERREAERSRLRRIANVVQEDENRPTRVEKRRMMFVGDSPVSDAHGTVQGLQHAGLFRRTAPSPA
jgi:hypothetical protein